MTSQGRMLVIRGGAIGDFILTVPALSALRDRFPETRLEVLGYPAIAQLAREGGVVDAVRPIESAALAGFFARNGDLDSSLHDYFRGFDVIFSYLFDPDEIFRTNIRRCLEKTTQYISGPYRPDDAGNRHAVDVFLQPLEHLAIFDADPTPRLNIPGDVEFLHQVHRSTVPWIAAHPGSGSVKKNWPRNKWRTFLETVLARRRVQLLIVGGEAEWEFLEELKRLLPPDRCRFCMGRSLTDLARMLKCCSMFVGHDSGVTHLASALGLPVVALWASTPPEVWEPRGLLVQRVDSKGDIRSLPVESVQAAFDRCLESVCHKP